MRRATLTAVVASAVSLTACARDAPHVPRTLEGPLARWVDPRIPARATCPSHAMAGYAQWPAPHAECTREDNGRVVASMVAAADSQVVSTVVSAVVPPRERIAAIAAESLAVASQLGAGRRCAAAIAWQRDGWYIVTRCLVTTPVVSEYDRKPYLLYRIGGLGRVPRAWCPELHVERSPSA